MNKNVLLIDFGASRIKSAYLLHSQEALLKNHDSLGSASIGHKCSTKFFVASMIEHLRIAEKIAPVEAIMICAEMHGYATCDNSSGLPGEYVSWRYSSRNDTNNIAMLNNNGFFEMTGMKAKAGLPVVNILSDSKIVSGNERVADIAFIPDSICRLMGESYHKVHASLAHASGLYTKDNEQLRDFGLPKLNCPIASDEDDVCIGVIKFQNRTIPCYGGYGDLQVSVMGVQPEKDQWIINLGTGSQIISLASVNNNKFEKRAYFNQKLIDCITHIPAGRALNIFANLFSEIRGETTSDHFWQIMKNMKILGEIDDLPVFDLAIFPQAFEFFDGGLITNIKEQHFDLNGFCVGLMNSFVEQYIRLLKSSDNDSRRPIILSGNMCQSIPIITEFFEKKWSSNISQFQKDIDPSILGLDYLAKLHLR
jgi:hypothetical protein